MSENKEIENYKKKKDQILDYSESQFDKQITFLSSGALVLTVGFVTDIVEITDNTDTSFLILSWVGFVCSLLSNLFSHITSTYSIRFDDSKPRLSDKFVIITDVLNWVSVITLLLGIIMFLKFITNNL